VVNVFDLEAFLSFSSTSLKGIIVIVQNYHKAAEIDPFEGKVCHLEGGCPTCTPPLHICRVSVLKL